MDWKKDRTLWALVGSNLITMAGAYLQQWNLLTIMCIYWSQSVIIGIFNIFKITQTTTDHKTFKRLPQGLPPWVVKYPIAAFFAVHYGGFHLVYMIFLLGMAFSGEFAVSGASFLTVPAFAGLFAINHGYSFFKNKKRDLIKKRTPMQQMALPYARIIPMHITLIIGFLFPKEAILLFLGLKTFADAVMHVREHR